MNSIYTDELIYMSTYYNRTDLSNITGIPSSTLGYVLRGERELPDKYLSNTHYQYSLTAYENLMMSGANRNAAMQVCGQPPENILDMQFRWQKLTSNLTSYRIALDWEKAGIKYTAQDIIDEIPNRINEIITGYQKLSVSLELAEQYVWYDNRIEI